MNNKLFPKLNENCSLQIEAQLFYSKGAQLELQIVQMIKQIENLSKQCQDEQSRSIKPLSSKQNGDFHHKSAALNNSKPRKQLRYITEKTQISNCISASVASLDTSNNSFNTKQRITRSQIVGLRERKNIEPFWNMNGSYDQAALLSSRSNKSIDNKSDKSKDTSNINSTNASLTDNRVPFNVSLNRIEARSPRRRI